MITSENEHGDYIVSTQDEKDLTEDRVLKSISIMKGKLELDCAMFLIKNIECFVTPSVKTNIIKAGKRAAMYGKQRPFVARFDEYGHRLPDEISIDSSRGITLKIVDPAIYGEFYFALRVTTEHTTDAPIEDDTVVDEIADLPF